MWLLVRLDKYLKVLCIIKCCFVVKEVVDKGCVKVNGVLVKLLIDLKFND